MTVSSPAHPRTGVWLFSDAPALELVDAIRLADLAGIDEVWVADEGVSREPVPVLAHAAASTHTVALGVGITSPLLRHPGAIGSTISTLDELSGGRARLGLGIGGSLSLDPFGIAIERPVAVMRDALRIARAVVTGIACDGYDPPTHAAPPREVPIFVGARGEQMNRLASREADGVFLSGFDLDRLAEPVGWARSVRPIHVAVYASARFASGAPADPTACSGSTTDVAAQLRDLVAEHRPDTIGLALVDGDSPVTMMRHAIETFDRLSGIR
jgi:alkanesulfonate monooxygenase SsuD/methylene tetrahydromethanopterin reductase-like flavin-dependent oxidoreductase (luciferase family)